MEPLFTRVKRRNSIHYILRCAVVLLVSMSMVGGTFFAVNADARNKFRNWIITHTGISIRFDNSEANMRNLFDYIIEFDNSDDSYELNLLAFTEYEKCFSLNKSTDEILIIAQIGIESTEIYVNDYSCIPVNINGLYGEFYEVYGGDGTNEMIWTENDSGIIMDISGKLSVEEMLMLANRISIYKK